MEVSLNAPSSRYDKAKLTLGARRKYRKMRAKFEDTMNQSNQLIKDEYKAIALARRLQEQNEYDSNNGEIHTQSADHTSAAKS